MFLLKNACEKFQDEVAVFGVSKESEHLKNCNECQDFIMFFHDVRLSAKQLPEATINPHVLTRLQAMAYEHVLRKRTSLWGAWMDWAAKLSPAMVVLILFMGFGYVMGANDKGQLADKATVSQDSVGMASLSYPSLSNTARGNLKPVSFSTDTPNQLGFSNVALGGVQGNIEAASSLSFERQLEEFRKLTMESDADTLLMRGRRLKAMGKVDQALKDFDNILSFYPNYTYMGDVLMYRAQCYAILGKFDEAIGSLEVYLEKNPSKRSLIEPMINQISETRDDGQILSN